MTDTTQSLGILDSKFSGKNLDIQSRISGLEVITLLLLFITLQLRVE